jgi:hypothetical protein
MDINSESTVVTASGTLKPVTEAAKEYTEVIPYIEPVRDPSKTGNKPKQLVAVEVMGYQVGRGLKRRVVPPEDIYKLAQTGATDREIARWFDINEETLRYNFQDIIEKGREDLKQSLRKAQIKLALSGNATMLIWLGKNMLGQQDNPVGNDEKKPLPWSDEE